MTKHLRLLILKEKNSLTNVNEDDVQDAGYMQTYCSASTYEQGILNIRCTQETQ